VKRTEARLHVLTGNGPAVNAEEEAAKRWGQPSARAIVLEQPRGHAQAGLRSRCSHAGTWAVEKSALALADWLMSTDAYRCHRLALAGVLQAHPLPPFVLGVCVCMRLCVSVCLVCLVCVYVLCVCVRALGVCMCLGCVCA